MSGMRPTPGKVPVLVKALVPVKAVVPGKALVQGKAVTPGKAPTAGDAPTLDKAPGTLQGQPKGNPGSTMGHAWAMSPLWGYHFRSFPDVPPL